MDAGDADVEAVPVAGHDAERVVARVSLRVRRSVDASVGQRAGGERMGIPVWTRETLT